MFLEWWMIVSLMLVWIVSLMAHGHIAFNQGATATMLGLWDQGYIRIKKEGEIIGLCNQNQYLNDLEENNDND
jgi:hypothetical protein